MLRYQFLVVHAIAMYGIREGPHPLYDLNTAAGLPPRRVGSAECTFMSSHAANRTPLCGDTVTQSRLRVRLQGMQPYL